jgi:hypothetical protein
LEGSLGVNMKRDHTHQELSMMAVMRAVLIRQERGGRLIGLALLSGLMMAAPVALASEAVTLVLRAEAETGPEASTSAPSSMQAWACQPPLDCDAVREQRIQRIRSGTLVRSLALVPDKVLEVYRDAAGRLDVLERPRRAAAANDRAEPPQAGAETDPRAVSRSE